MQLPTNYDHVQCPNCGEGEFINMSQDLEGVDISCSTCGFTESNENDNVEKDTAFEEVFPKWYVEEKAVKEEDDDSDRQRV